MVKIPESHRKNIPNQLKLDPKDKINQIGAIVNLMIKESEFNAWTFFEYFKIDLRNHPDFYNYPYINFCKETLEYSLRSHKNDRDIQDFYNYLHSNQILDFFHDKNACLEIFKLEKYQDLKQYLDECFNCLKSNNNLAFIIVLRACSEFFLKEIKKQNNKNNKKWKIDFFIEEINSNDEYKILKPKINEIKILLDLFRIAGNNVAHGRLQEANEFIEKYCLKTNLELFCIILENSIFKEDILRINTDFKSKKIKSMDFSPKKIDNKIVEKTTNQTNNFNENDEIPF